MSKRLAILKNSLLKKQSKLDEKFSAHFADVKSANGQPLNDKRNGQATMDRWERQSASISTLKESIEKTENAIEKEENKISNIEGAKEVFPAYILDLINDGTLKQWTRHPSILFVEGVDGARLVFKDGIIKYRYLNKIIDKGQHRIFADVFNSINKIQRELNKGEVK